jgi:nucleoside-diphosphate-sugar epimerase
MNISIIGLGWLGFPLAQALLRRGYTVIGTTTSPEKLPDLQAAGIDAHLLRLNPKPEPTTPRLWLNAEVMIVNIPPKASAFGDGFHPQQIAHLAEAVSASAIKWVIYVSSTSVYPELNRVMVEDDVIAVAQSAAPALAQAERIWRRVSSYQPHATILRCGGLMGYDRLPGRYVAGKTVDTGASPVNYIHRDDAIGLITSVLDKHLLGTYNMVAPQHPTREAVYRTSCARHGFVLPTFVEPAVPVPFKIVDSQKIIKSTGYEFLHPYPLAFV